MTDRDLLAAYAESRDVESLGAFLGRYQDSLVRFVSGYLQDENAAQDIVQETFLRVARHPQRLLDVSNCHNWLLRVARNLSVDHLRGVIRRRKHTAAYARQRAAEAAAREASLAEPADAAVEREEVRRRVREEIRQLNPRLKELMLLKVQEGKTYREIAGITGLSVTNVGYLLHRAMKTLAVRLKDLREDRE
ncbi:MAG: RNA polymerase sigma factor [Planctomycetota bacterium]|nr:RNA polymerase sigma factor [Planctomycetota bacterium]